eukprot:Amastigsp_a339960_35.p2 type:complete len:269 gc:universal Amastigsp_a339960_35:2460-1654(-)
MRCCDEREQGLDDCAHVREQSFRAPSRSPFCDDVEHRDDKVELGAVAHVRLAKRGLRDRVVDDTEAAEQRAAVADGCEELGRAPLRKDGPDDCVDDVLLELVVARLGRGDEDDLVERDLFLVAQLACVLELLEPAPDALEHVGHRLADVEKQQPDGFGGFDPDPQRVRAEALDVRCGLRRVAVEDLLERCAKGELELGRKVLEERREPRDDAHLAREHDRGGGLEREDLCKGGLECGARDLALLGLVCGGGLARRLLCLDLLCGLGHL